MVQHAGSYTSFSPDEWDKRIKALDANAASCELCPRRCKINRLAGERGFCQAPPHLVVADAFPNRGEETPISGFRGSGTVFFTHCTLKCVFCQNFHFSHLAQGIASSPDDLAGKMLELQNAGCHNINLVTPTHFLPWIVRALKKAARAGLTLPIVFNSGGYELPATLRFLAGIVDIYLTDMKYGSNVQARRYSNAPDYVKISRKALLEMFRQTGPLVLDEDGIAVRGVCIRHLVLPGALAGARRILDFLRNNFKPEEILISLLSQYQPVHQAADYSRIKRGLRYDEYEPLRQEFMQSGFKGFFQEVRRLDPAFLAWEIERRKKMGSEWS